jgi:hypothetical protein
MNIFNIIVPLTIFHPKRLPHLYLVYDVNAWVGGGGGGGLKGRGFTLEFLSSTFQTPLNFLDMFFSSAENFNVGIPNS